MDVNNIPSWDECPPIPKELLTYLNRVVPERSPSLGQNIEVIMFEAGKRETVRLLTLIYNHQQEDG